MGNQIKNYRPVDYVCHNKHKSNQIKSNEIKAVSVRLCVAVHSAQNYLAVEGIALPVAMADGSQVICL